MHGAMDILTHRPRRRAVRRVARTQAEAGICDECAVLELLDDGVAGRAALADEEDAIEGILRPFVPARTRVGRAAGSCDLTRKRDGTGKHVMTGGGRKREDVARIIGSLLCYCSKGSDSITASEHDYREADKRCQE
jgi:hypothetical protein